MKEKNTHTEEKKNICIQIQQDQKMAKRRVNWTISQECLSLIKSACALSKNATKSSIVEYCIKHSLGNKREHLVNKKKQILMDLAEIEERIMAIDKFEKKGPAEDLDDDF